MGLSLLSMSNADTSSVVIADEAHRLKEPFAALTLAMKKIQCQSCFALTGTLYQNRMDEMWSVLDFVSVRSPIPSIH